MKKILFFTNPITLAHVTRPIKMMEVLDPAKYEIYVATDQQYKSMFSHLPVKFLSIECLLPEKMSKLIEKAKPFYDKSTFEKHIKEDIEIIEQVRPQIVVGDMRLSLSVSSRLKKVPYINLTNAYWSSEIKRPFPIPEAPAIRFLGEKFSLFFFSLFGNLMMKFFLYLFIRPIKKTLAQMSIHFNDWRKLYIDGDITLFFDSPELVPLKKVLPNQRFMGPLVWSIKTPLPDWWKKLDNKKKWIFFTLGSSGNTKTMDIILNTLSKIDAEVLVATAGKNVNKILNSNMHYTDFLPVEEVSPQCRLVISNGGSPVSYCALLYGVPVLGIISNTDQALVMSMIEDRGAGIKLRYWNISEKILGEAINKILKEDKYVQNAMKIQNEFQRYDFSKGINDVLEKIQ